MSQAHMTQHEDGAASPGLQMEGWTCRKHDTFVPDGADDCPLCVSVLLGFRVTSPPGSPKGTSSGGGYGAGSHGAALAGVAAFQECPCGRLFCLSCRSSPTAEQLMAMPSGGAGSADCDELLAAAGALVEGVLRARSLLPRERTAYTTPHLRGALGVKLPSGKGLAVQASSQARSVRVCGHLLRPQR